MHIINPMHCKLFISDFSLFGYTFKYVKVKYENLSKISEFDLTANAPFRTYPAGMKSSCPHTVIDQTFSPRLQNSLMESA